MNIIITKEYVESSSKDEQTNKIIIYNPSEKFKDCDMSFREICEKDENLENAMKKTREMDEKLKEAQGLLEEYTRQTDEKTQ